METNQKNLAYASCSHYTSTDFSFSIQVQEEVASG
jgi:hypothetical protein